MAIPSKPINRLTSPRWHTTFRGDGQPKLSWQDLEERERQFLRRSSAKITDNAACSYSEISVPNWDFGETFATRYESFRQRTKVGLIDLIARKTQQLSDLNYLNDVTSFLYPLRTLHYEVNSGSYLIFNLEKNHCFLNPEIPSLKPVFPVSHRGFVRRFSGEPESVRTRVRCLWKDLAARNLYLLTLSCLEVRTNTYSRCFLDKNHLVLSKPETLIRFERKCSFRSLEQSVNPLVSEPTFNLKANVRDEDMAIPSKPVNRLTSPRWRTTFRGDGQPKLSSSPHFITYNLWRERNTHTFRDSSMIPNAVFWLVDLYIKDMLISLHSQFSGWFFSVSA
ncbi:hypothetical protein YC2023_117089 [Brassica napus]